MLASSSSVGDRKPRGIATAALKRAGLIDEDERMRDLTTTKKTAGGTKDKSNKKTGHRQRAADPFKNARGPDLANRMTASRLASTLSNPLAIRGASAKPSSSLSIRSRVAGHSQVPAMDVWREFVQKRWNPEARFLNLERISDDEVLKKYNITPPGLPGSNRKEMPVVFKLASQLKPPVETLSLAHNNFSGIYLQALSRYLPKIRNLSLQGNGLKTWKDIDYLSGKAGQLSQLREIILINNPIREFELKNGRAENYRSEMTKRFPALEVLDQEAVTRISFDVPSGSSSHSTPSGPSITTFPFPMSPSFVTGVDGSLISNFLTRYFPLFDAQRSALIDVYSPNATFSYGVVTQIPARARVQGFHTSKEMPNQRKLEWSPWLKNSAGGSRNLSRMGGGLDRMVQSLHVGPDEIVKAMSALPGTRHEITGAIDKYCIDAWPVGQGDTMLLFLCMHGEFAEAPSQGIRSFDRSFILAPAPADSRARLSGWDIVILSDQLNVRAYSSPEAWKPGPLRVQSRPDEAAALSTPQQTQPQLPSSGLSPEVQVQLNTALSPIPEPQRSLVLAICQRTGLNVKFAVECLEGNNWEVEKAIVNFEQVKGTLPREAFL